MPSSRRARAPSSSQPLYAESDSGGDTDKEDYTPKPARHGVKKRLSEVYNDVDASFSSDRAPLRSVNINDDAAEKRRRRRSTKITAILDPEDGTEQEPGRAAQGKAKLLTSAAPPPVINVPLDVMSSNFEEWMKMATDNKINAANSWNFALIDYFHDMSLLRNNTDNSINFQRASCTLDGCVKIWTSRVDSVGTETGKLLSNLANEGKVGADNDDDGEAGSDNPDANEGGARKRKNHRPESTLAKNAAQLRSKKLDLEFSVDPLFKKTCADFDEGGAQGLLMNHLSLGVGADGGLRVVFDASDSMGKAGEEEEEEEVVEEPVEEVDLSHLRKHFLPNLDVLDDKAISHSLAHFSFSKDAFTFDDHTFFLDDPRRDNDFDHDDENEPFGGGDNEMPMDLDGGGPDVGEAPAEDFFTGDQAVHDDYNMPDMDNDYGDGGMGSANGDGDGESGSGSGIERHGQQGPGGAFVPFDLRRVPNERDLVMAMTGDGDGEGGMMDYFDQNFLKNWAGPEHWKLRKIVRRPEASETTKPKAAREKKEAFKIDFTSPLEKDLKETARELFAPVTRGAGITLPGTSSTSTSRKRVRGKKNKEKEKEKKDDHRLPDDMHFTSRQLVTLFLKPKFSLKMRGQPVRMNENGDEVDENFWAQAAADQAAGRNGDEENDETANGGAIPFNTQFFHDDYDDGPGFDDVFEGEGDGGEAIPDVDAGEQDLLAATAGQTRRVRPEFVNYAKRAKRVDVRKLKENIWKGLDIKIAEAKEETEDELMETDDPNATDPSEARVFSSVISGLQKNYPRDKMEEISTSFCFICLLHLANEQGLKLECAPDGKLPSVVEDIVDDEVVSVMDKKVGNLWDLKVYRDPHATPAA